MKKLVYNPTAAISDDSTEDFDEKPITNFKIVCSLDQAPPGYTVVS